MPRVANMRHSRVRQFTAAPGIERLLPARPELKAQGCHREPRKTWQAGSRVGVKLPGTIGRLSLFLRGWSSLSRIGSASEKLVQTDWQIVLRLERLLTPRSKP
jgi:hypothetical protein